MKPSFTVAGVTFDTQAVYKGLIAYSNANSAGKLEGAVVKNGVLPHIKDEAILKKHGNLFQRFNDVAKKFDLPKQPRLGISNYGYPFACTTAGGDIMMDGSMLKLFEPDELDDILAHEFAHLELRHNHKGGKREQELAADELAAERMGDSKGLRSGLHKIDQFKEGLRNASFRYRMLEGVGRVATSVSDAIADKQTRCPTTYQRTDRLKKLDRSFATREKDEFGSERTNR